LHSFTAKLPSELAQKTKTKCHKKPKLFGGFGIKVLSLHCKNSQCDQICSKNSLNTLEKKDNFR